MKVNGGIPGTVSQHNELNTSAGIISMINYILDLRRYPSMLTFHPTIIVRPARGPPRTRPL